MRASAPRPFRVLWEWFESWVGQNMKQPGLATFKRENQKEVISTTGMKKRCLTETQTTVSFK